VLTAITRLIHVPVAVVCSATALVLLLRLLTALVPNSTVVALAAVLGAICLPLFAVAVVDKDTRAAVDCTRAGLNRQWPSMTWRQRALVPQGSDRLLLFLNRLLWVEATVALLLDQPAFVLAFAGFALTTILIFLELAHPPSGAADPSS
jgi:hypothetical protein